MTGPMLKKNRPHVSRMPPWTMVGIRSPKSIFIIAKTKEAAPIMTEIHIREMRG